MKKGRGLKAQLKYLCYRRKFISEAQLERLITALDVVDEIKKEEYMDTENHGKASKGWNSCLRYFKQMIGEEE